MIIVLIVSNFVLASFLLLSGFFYPSLAHWSYFAVALIAFHLVLHLMVAQARILDAAKISIWGLQALSSLLSISLLLPFKLGWGSLWALLSAGLIGVMALITVIVFIAYPNAD